MAGEEGERVEPWLLHGIRRHRRWQHGHTAHWASRHVTLGQLADGRWLVEHTDVTIGSRAYRSQERAQQEIGRLTADGEWTEVPAAYGADGKPIGEGWQRSGGNWVRVPGVTPSDH
ncbi:hypothetical protein ACH4T9_12675 [Micromonospora sp. NPDC020750]|uniref:hypothetical protein n=1 Tax=unclassified Micromonospora TaxID=2617518 RepID=UPI0037ADB943